jgi:quercetin dioxygenase-like cupin family protein
MAGALGGSGGFAGEALRKFLAAREPRLAADRRQPPEEDRIMKTVELARDQIEARISRFADLKPLPIQTDPEIPLAAKDLVYCRKLLSVIGLEGGGTTPISANAPIRGAAGMTMTIGVCPPGTGPGLHAHQKTHETFTILQGRFEFRWNDEGEESVVLDRFDTISFPPKINRAFTNVGDEDGIIQVLITGGVHDMNDIEAAPVMGAKLREFGSAVFRKFEDTGVRFNAHKNAVE